MQVINDLLDYNKLKIYQDTDMFNFSLDSVLLPNFITIPLKTENILDIGTGNGPIPLILTTKTDAKITGVEIQSEVADLAQKSVKLNNLQNQITIINEDINILKDELPINHFDIITCNPPYFKVNKESKLNKSDYKTIARHEITLNINDLCAIAKRLLKNDGILGIVHRPERLTDILITMRENNIEPKKIRFVAPKKATNANTVLIEGVLNGKKGLTVLPTLISHKANGEYTEEIKQYFKVE